MLYIYTKTHVLCKSLSLIQFSSLPRVVVASSFASQHVRLKLQLASILIIISHCIARERERRERVSSSAWSSSSLPLSIESSFHHHFAVTLLLLHCSLSQVLFLTNYHAKISSRSKSNLLLIKLLYSRLIHFD